MGKNKGNINNQQKNANPIPQAENKNLGSLVDKMKQQISEMAKINSIKGDAEKIVADRDKILQEAQEKAEKFLQECQSIYDKIKEEQQNMTAALKAAEQKKVEAEEECKERVLEAQKAYSELIAEGEEAKNKAIEEKSAIASIKAETILQAAATERDNIIESATKNAEIEVRNIRQAASNDAERILKQAKETAEKKLAEAEQEAERIRKSAEDSREKSEQEYSEKLRRVREDRQEFENERSKFYSTQESRIEEAIGEHERELSNREAELAAERDTLKIEKEKFNYDTNRLEQRKLAIEQLIQKRVEEELVAQNNATERQRVQLNTLAKENKNLNDQIGKMQIRLAKYMSNDLSEDRLNDLEEKNKLYEEKIAEYKQKNSELQNKYYALEVDKDHAEEAARDKNSLAILLDSEKRRNSTLKEQLAEVMEELDNRKKVTREDMLEPILHEPDNFLDAEDLNLDKVYLSEIEWLKHIQEKSSESGIKFSLRQLKAYHTALKVEDWSPLVVLAGVSGTGKSELPKQYAKHGGLNFISIPVKPDWDSPASLFGYYNSIENKFEATELLRSLYQMQGSGKYRNQMLLVLLDEMNLAHPEQYFADLLSKFETARGENKNAFYEIGLGCGEVPEKMEIGKNVLWTGTMNEDETTKGLSDKVVDRSTLISFPRPKEFYDRSNSMPVESEYLLTTDIWDTWKDRAIAISDNVYEGKLANQIHYYKKCIEEINNEMSFMGRNLGHRVWQSIQNYILNYPDVIYFVNSDDMGKLYEALATAFADAVAFKVMPKLRGLELEGDNKQHLNKIENTLKAYNVGLVEDYGNARKQTSGLFQWCSAEFMNDDNQGNEAK